MANVETYAATCSQAPRTLTSTLRLRLDLWRTRRALARLDAHLLKDIGKTAQQARHEADLTVWDVPANWSDRA